MKFILNGVDVFNPIEGKLEDITKCFIQVLGEKYRNKIVNNFKNITFIFVPQVGSLPMRVQLEDYIDDYNIPDEILKIDEGLSNSEDEYMDACYHKIIKHMAQIKNMSYEDILKDKKIYIYADDYFSLIDYDLSNLHDNLHLTQSTKNDFIKLLNYLGFDYGSNFDEYIHNSKIKRTIFNEQLLKDLEKENLNKNKSIIKKLPYLAENVSRIKNLNAQNGSFELIDNLILFELEDYNTLAYCQAYKKAGDDDRMHHICVFPWAVNGNDENIIHELTHAASTSIIKIIDGNTFVKNGIDEEQDSEEFKDYNEDNYKRISDDSNFKNIELLNEVIVEFFANKVYENLKKKNITINICDQSNKDLVSYVKCFSFIKPFMSKNEEILKDCLMSDDHTMIYRVMGNDNVEQLANLLKTYFGLRNDPDLNDLFKKEVSYHLKNDCKGSKYSDLIHNPNIVWSDNALAFVETIRSFDKLKVAIQNNIDNYIENEKK